MFADPVRSTKRPKGAPKEVLILLHQAHSATGRVGRLLQGLGYTLDIRYPTMDAPLPFTLERYAGVVVYGGPMCANDGDAWLRREIDWLAIPLRENKPFLGLCLGAQLMARQLGARVYSSRAHGELGYHPLRPTAAADALCPAPFPRHAYQWHFDGFDIPQGAHRLAEGVGAYPNQAYIYGGNVVGLQFHPEVTYHMICRWTTRNAARLGALGAQLRRQQIDGWYQFDAAAERWISAFLAAWVNAALHWPYPSAASSGYAVAAE